MIKLGTKVVKKGNKDFYTVRKLWLTFAEIDKINKNWLERMSNVTEYIELDKLEEVDEDTTGGCSGYS